MNQIIATVREIENVDNLHIIALEFSAIQLTMLTLDLPMGVCVGTSVVVSVKPSHVVIAKDLQGDISFSNLIPANISKIDQGRLVAMVESQVYDVTLQSLITHKSVKRLKLQEGDSVTLLIQASALSITEVQDVGSFK
ncbi:MAG: TOBE domain-containing protein [Epsilonproteobacteria bacterium]|nr:TOBE domain-containing protein [Campylobacterota bacterium]